MKDRKEWNNGYWWGWTAGVIGANIGWIIAKVLF